MENPLTNVHIEPICETEIINAISEFPKSCKALSVKHNKEIWHQLVNRNKWIYLAPQPTKLIIKCDNKTYSEILQNSGIITFRGNCIAYTNKNKIEIYQELNDDLDILIPNLNIQSDNIFSFNFTNININITNRIVKPNKILDLSYFNTLSNELKLHQTYIENFQNAPVFRQHLFINDKYLALPFILFTISIFLIITVYVKLSRQISQLDKKIIYDETHKVPRVRKRKHFNESD